MSPSVSHAHRGLLHLPHVGTPKSTGPTWRRALSKAAATGRRGWRNPERRRAGVTRNWANRIRPSGSRAPLVRSRALPNRRPEPRARTERRTSRDRGVAFGGAPTSAPSWVWQPPCEAPSSLRRRPLLRPISPSRLVGRRWRRYLSSSMMLAGGGAMRPRGTAAIAGRSVGTRTMRGLRGLTRPQSRSDRVSPTQDGLSAAAGAP